MAYLQRVRFRRETSLIPSLIIRFTRDELVKRALPKVDQPSRDEGSVYKTVSLFVRV